MCKAREFFIFFVVLFSSYRCWVLPDIEHLDFDNMIPDEDLDNIKDEEGARQRFNLIFPATKWCGAGNIAENYDDLGSARETDMCCREHDNCPDIILAGESKNNLTNSAFYTRLNCACDEKFRQCLHAANSTRVGDKVGKIYFNALGTKCYREDYPVTGCKTYGGWFKRKCLEPLYDTNASMVYQWFDVNNY